MEMQTENVKDFRSSIKKKWSKLSDEDLKNVDGNLEALVDRIEKVYGIPHNQAEQQVQDLKSQLTNRQPGQSSGQTPRPGDQNQGRSQGTPPAH